MMTKIAKAVIERDGKYLLLRRAGDLEAYPGLWDFPGGRLDEGETARDAVVREVREETGLRIEAGEVAKRESYEDVEWELDIFYFVLGDVAGEVRIGPEHAEFEWVSEEEAQGLDLHPAAAVYFGI